MRPGTLITVRGTGFVPGSTVQFGAPQAVAVPTFLSADGTLLTVPVPRLAVNGPLTVLRPSLPALTSRTFTVHNYRNTDAFSFHNFRDFDIPFGLVSDVFGYNATHVTVSDVVPPPVGWLMKLTRIDVATPIPSPLALAFTAFAQATLTNGACFGMSLLTQHLLNHPELINGTYGLPAGQPRTVFNLQRNGELQDEIVRRHLCYHDSRHS